MLPIDMCRHITPLSSIRKGKIIYILANNLGRVLSKNELYTFGLGKNDLAGPSGRAV